MKKLLYILAFLLLVTNMFPQQKINRIKRSNFEGRHFFLGFMQNETTIDPRTGLVLRVFISTNADANILVQIPGAMPQSYSIKQDSVLTFLVPPDVEEYTSEIPEPKAIEITADVPVSVYAFSSQAFSTDAFSAIPVSFWGTEYVCMSFENDQYQVTSLDPIDSAYQAEPRQSEFMVVAAYDSTIISFSPKNVTQNGKQTFRTYNISLNKGECYLVKSVRGPKGTGDLTGTIVRSNLPVGFITGHVRTAVPTTLPYIWDSKNHLVEMMMPTDAWGRHFITTPIGATSNGDMFRITNIKPGTTVYYTTFSGNSNSFVLSAPGDYETLWYINEPVVWSSDYPIQICQYMCHHGGADDSQGYDPAFAAIPPVEQYVSRILFQCPGDIFQSNYIKTQFNLHRAALLIDTLALPSFRLDGKYMNSFMNISQNRIPGTPYCYAYFDLKKGKHEFMSDTGFFSGIMYGLGTQDAYAMIIGSSLTNPYKNDTIPPVLSIQENCGKISGSACDVPDSNMTGLDYAIVDKKLTFNYKWKISTISDTATCMSFTAEPVDVTKDGNFVIDIRDKNGNGTRYTFVYNGLKITLPDSLTFAKVDANDSVCYTFYVKNYGKDSVTLSQPYLWTNDQRLRFSFDKGFPFVLKSGDSIKCIICFDPFGDTTSLITKMDFGFDCDRLFSIPIKCSVRYISALADGYNFRGVRVGDTICAFAYIINDGSDDIRIDSVIIPQPSNPFKVDTAGLFPVKLSPGKSIAIPVCFHPDSTISYELNCTAVNGLTYGNGQYKYIPFKLKGRGIAPDFEPLIVDWGKRRIGTRSDSAVFVINSGTDTGTVAMTKMYGIEVFNKLDHLNFTHKFFAGDSFALNFGFEPLDTVSYFGHADYCVDWKFHKPFYIELKGIGSLPVIKTYDIDFGKVVINKTKDSLCRIITAGGNENLTVDSIYYFSGDNNAFKFNSLSNGKLMVDFNTDWTEHVKFTPDRIGNFETVFEVLNDAMPAYKRTKNYIRMTGIGLTSDTLNAILTLEIPETIISCQTSRFYAVLKNTGNVDLNLQSMNFDCPGTKAEWGETINYPVLIRRDSSFKIPIDVFTTNSTDTYLTITATLNDTIVRTVNYHILPKVLPIIVDKISNLRGYPGDTVLLSAEGKFPTRTEKPVNFKIIFTLKEKNLLLTVKNSYLTVLENNIPKKYSLTLNQDLEKVEVISDGAVDVPEDNTGWQFILPFEILLSDEREPDLNVRAVTDDCFQQGLFKSNVNILDVCANNLRNILLVESQPSFSIDPNPAGDQLTLKIFLPKDETISLKIFDKVGKKCYYSENLILKKGFQSLIFENCNLTDGWYFLSIQTSDGINKNLKFIILK